MSAINTILTDLQRQIGKLDQALEQAQDERTRLFRRIGELERETRERATADAVRAAADAAVLDAAAKWRARGLAALKLLGYATLAIAGSQAPRLTAIVSKLMGL